MELINVWIGTEITSSLRKLFDIERKLFFFLTLFRVVDDIFNGSCFTAFISHFKFEFDRCHKNNNGGNNKSVKDFFYYCLRSLCSLGVIEE